MAASLTEPAPRVIHLRFARRTFLAFVLLALLSGLLSVLGKLVGHSIALAGHTEDRTPYEIVIGNDVLSVPANLIRFEQARRNGVAARLDLYLRWPTLEGYEAKSRDEFNNAGGSRDILFLSIQPRSMSLDMTGRWEPIYRRLVEPSERKGPQGVVFRDFTPESGYENETLALLAQSAKGLLVARCLTGPAAAGALAPCARDIQIGRGLSLTYRFPESLLADWPRLEEAIRDKAATLLRTAG